MGLHFTLTADGDELRRNGLINRPSLPQFTAKLEWNWAMQFIWSKQNLYFFNFVEDVLLFFVWLIGKTKCNRTQFEEVSRDLDFFSFLAQIYFLYHIILNFKSLQFKSGRFKIFFTFSKLPSSRLEPFPFRLYTTTIALHLINVVSLPTKD